MGSVVVDILGGILGGVVQVVSGVLRHMLDICGQHSSLRVP